MEQISNNFSGIYDVYFKSIDEQSEINQNLLEDVQNQFGGRLGIKVISTYNNGKYALSFNEGLELTDRAIHNFDELQDDICVLLGFYFKNSSKDDFEKIIDKILKRSETENFA